MTDHEKNLETLKGVYERVYGDDFVWDDGTTDCPMSRCDEWLWHHDDTLLTSEEVGEFWSNLVILRDS